MRDSKTILDEQFPAMRERCLSLAADLDRISRAGSDLADDPRIRDLHAAMQILLEPGNDRARRVLEVFSDMTPLGEK